MSGAEQIVVNTGERAVSNDVNRLQQFAARDRAEALRALLDTTSGTDDLDAGALYSPNTTTTAPLTAEVLAGLLVQPQLANFSLLVTAGVLHAVVPDANADNSAYMYCSDPGVSLVGSLTIGANASGQPRIDVVECQPAQAVIETDNRDIFNPITGLFSATTVTKATAARLTYRVRAGTAGSGYPAAVSGWLPLMVALVPNGATSNDSCTFWDVRPLVNDRERAPLAVSSSKPRIARLGLNALSMAAVTGAVDVNYLGRRLGGRLRRGTPGTDSATQIALNDAANQDGAGATLTNGTPWFLYLLVPFGLPRWARYTDASSGSRVPRSPRGIPVLTGTVGPNVDGTPSSAITLPTGLGFAGATTASGVCVAAGWVNGATARGLYGDEHGYVLGAVGLIPTVAGSVADPSLVTFTANTHYPACARALLVAYSVSLQEGSSAIDNAAPYLAIYSPNAGAQVQQVPLPIVNGRYNNTDAWKFAGQVWVPLPSIYPSNTPPTQQLGVGIGSSFATVTASTFAIYGWRF